MTSESQNIEFKVSWRDEYLKWICGFANAQGGTIFIGKDDSGNVVDLKDAKNPNGRNSKQSKRHFRDFS